MKKIALYTIQSINYGNRLQNYASQEIIKSLGYDVMTLRNSPKESEVKLQLELRPYLYVIKPILPLISYVKTYIFGFFNINKSNNYRLFNKKIKFASEYIGVEGYSNNLKKYDAVIAGSDQIWNTEFSFVSRNSFFPFEHPCKISFSSSFGTENIPSDIEIAKSLKKFKRISVREDAGAKIINNLIGENVEVLVDPTMLLTIEEWKKVSKKPRGFNNKLYVLTYFLSPKSEKALEQLNKLKKEGLQVYELFDNNNIVTRCAGPSEFLYLIENAAIILTDSFHACVFSFLYNKPFIIYDRNKKGSTMNSRINTLLKKFKIERKYENSGLENDIWEHDYAEGYEILKKEKEKSINFLKRALED